MEEGTTEQEPSASPVRGSPDSVPHTSVDASETQSTHDQQSSTGEPSKGSASTSESTSRSTSPTGHSSSTSCDTLIDPTMGLTHAEWQVYKAVMKLQWIHGEQGAMTRQVCQEYKDQHCCKKCTFLEARYMPSQLLPPTGEPSRVQTPKSAHKRPVNKVSIP